MVNSGNQTLVVGDFIDVCNVRSTDEGCEQYSVKAGDGCWAIREANPGKQVYYGGGVCESHALEIDDVLHICDGLHSPCNDLPPIPSAPTAPPTVPPAGCDRHLIVPGDVNFNIGCWYGTTAENVNSGNETLTVGSAIYVCEVRSTDDGCEQYTGRKPCLILCCVVLSFVLCCLILSCSLALPGLVLPCLVFSCLVLSSLVSCLLSLVLSCLV
jgi:hypothetical protein